MRITNSMMSTNMVRNLNKNMKSMDKYQTQLYSGKKITKISDDPIGVTQSLQARSNYAKTLQYKANAKDAQSIMTFSETSLMSINGMLTRAYELTVDATNQTNSIDETNAIAVEVREIRDEIVNTLNATHGSNYVFGGYNVAETPFTMQGDEVLFNGVNITTGDLSVLNDLKNQSISYDLNKGVSMEVSINGLSVTGVGQNNIFNKLNQLIDSLQTGKPTGGFIKDMQDASENVLSVVSEIGGKTNRLNSMISRFESEEINYRELMSNVEDIDYEEVITEFKMQESVYRAALAVGARVIQPSLVDFLR